MILGSFWGSFLGYLGYCYISGEKLSLRRSRCEHCQAVLRCRDLLPIIGYLYRGGRCRYCHKKIKFSYFILESATALSFTLIRGLGAYDLWLFAVISVLLLIGWIDSETMLIPQGLLLGVLLLVVINLFCFKSELFLSKRILGSIVISGLMSISNLIKKDSFGWGDVMLLVMVGGLLGIEKTVTATIVATLSALPVAVYHRYIKRYEQKYLAFAPFLVLGIITMFF